MLHVAALGAAWVRVHGLVNCVRDGVLLFVPWRLRPCEHAAQLQQSVLMTVFCLAFSSSTELDIAVLPQ